MLTYDDKAFLTEARKKLTFFLSLIYQCLSRHCVNKQKIYAQKYVTYRWSFLSSSPASCISPLGLESGEIKDAALTHSLPSSNPSKPEFIRLHKVVNNFPYGWSARSAQVPPDYLQIDFGSLRRVTRMSTMGGTLPFFYVSSYQLQYSLDGITWMDYHEKGKVKVSEI